MFANARSALKRSWEKNSYELAGLLNGGLPRFVISAAPAELGTKIPVFCYHTISADHLRDDLEFLKRNRYRTLSGDELLKTLRGERPAGEREVVLSFDDGAVNFYEVAFPLLIRHEARALCFVAPGMHFDEPPRAFRHVRERPMTWTELREIHATRLVDIESHTLESRHVPTWPEPRSLNGVAPALEDALRGTPLPIEEDFRRAKALLEAQLPGKVVRHLAFPAYDGTPDAVAAARRCGYEACHWGIIPGQPLNALGTSPWEISRCSHEFVRRLPGEERQSFGGMLGQRLRIIRAAHSKSRA
jgi:peptidoglycan/xylan/chitin deacetylase (PgdA/CDA1 family)